MPASKKLPRSKPETLKVHIKAMVTAVLDTPPIKWAAWLTRTIPMTTGIVLLLCAIAGMIGFEEGIADARATWGLNPENPISWFTHAFLHNDGRHLALNIMVFWTSGGLVELYLGRSKLAVIMFTGIAAAAMSIIAVPEYWVTNSNPIGISAVAQAIFVLGVYLAWRVITVWLAKTLPPRQYSRNSEMGCGPCLAP